MVRAEDVTLQDCITGLSRGHSGALRVALEILETCADNAASLYEASLLLLLLSSRGYVGLALWELYADRADCSAAQALNLVIEEAWREMDLGLNDVRPFYPGLAID